MAQDISQHTSILNEANVAFSTPHAINRHTNSANYQLPIAPTENTNSKGQVLISITTIKNNVENMALKDKCILLIHTNGATTRLKKI